VQRTKTRRCCCTGSWQEGLQQEIGLRPEFASEMAARLVAYLRRRLGAQEIYIPGAHRVPSAMRRSIANSTGKTRPRSASAIK
jgi:hypothetical protein